MINEEHVRAIVGYIADSEINAPIMIDYVRFLKNLIETDVGVNKERQK